MQYLSAQNETFDAVLMDVQMPVMDGLAATRTIRQELGLKDLPIIVLTAGVLTEHRRQATDAGASDFLAKPIELDELVAVLLRCAGNRLKASKVVGGYLNFQGCQCTSKQALRHLGCSELSR